MDHPNRRAFLKTTAWTLAVGAAPLDRLAFGQKGDDAPPADPYGAYADEAPLGRGSGGYGATTSPDIEGPFYRSGAPFRSDLAPEGARGRPLRLEGRVVKGLECVPVAGAVLDVWLADARGHYDNDDPRRPPRGYTLRGRVRVDDEAAFALDTIWPGRYRIGPDRWRPAHLHLKVTGPGCAPLTTQLYFADDPHNEGDPWFDPSRALAPEEDEEGVWVTRYEVVLEARG